MRRAIATLVGVIGIANTTQLPAQTPQEVSGFDRAMQVYHKRGDLETARAMLDRLLSESTARRAQGNLTDGERSHYGSMFMWRSHIRRKQGDAAGAERDLDTATALAPMLGSRDVVRGHLLNSDKDTRGALQAFTRAIRADSQDARAWLARGMLRMAMRDSAGGRADLERAARLGDMHAPTFLGRQTPARIRSTADAATMNRRAGELEKRGVVYARERDAALQAQPAGLPEAASPVTAPSRDARRLLVTAVPWLAGFAAFVLLFVAAFAAWLRLTPASKVARFDTQPGERQLSIRAPVQGPVFAPGALRHAAASVLYVLTAWGLLFVWTDGFTRFGTWVFVVPGIPFTVVTLYKTFGRHFVEARRRKITVYALTNQRAIVSAGDDVQYYPLETLRSATLVDHGDGTGTISWGSVESELERATARAIAGGQSLSSIDVRGLLKSEIRAPRKFERIASAKTVFAKLREVADAAASEADSAPATIALSGDDSAPAATQTAAPTSADRQEKRGVRVSFARSASASPRQTALFGAIFTLVGLVGTYFFGYRPVAEFMAARDWLGVPCQVVSSALRTSTSRNRDSDGHTRTQTTYNVDVAFRYEYSGQRYTGTRYQLRPVGRGGLGAYSAIQAKVNALPAGLTTTCWLDPVNPENAVLDRSMTLGTWMGLIPLTFLAIGVAVLVGAARKRMAA